MKNRILPRLFFARKIWMKNVQPILKKIKISNQKKSKEPTEKRQKNQLFSLSKLKTLSQGSPEFVDNMIQVFITELPESLRLLENHMKNKSYDRIRAVAHIIKPSINIMEIESVETSIQQLEDYASSKTNLEQIPALVQEVIDTCNKTILQLHKRNAR